MKKIVLMLLFMLMCAVPCLGAFTRSIDNRKTYKNAYRWTGKPRDFLLDWAQEVEDRIDGTTGVDFIFYVPGTAPDTTEGNLYYSSSLDALVLRTASAWVTLEAGGDFSSLDEGYNGGAAIDVDSGAVTMTAGNADDNDVLAVVQDDTGTTSAVVITNAGSGSSIEIDGTSGNDIEGTGDVWAVTTAGLGTLVGLTVGAEDIQLENGGEIQNVVDTELRFMENSEDFILDFTDDGITTKSGTGVVAINWGDIDAHTGLASIAGDAAADFAISAANSGTFNFTIAQAGTGDNQVIISSAGTATNAIALTASVAGITATALDDITIQVTSSTGGEDILITQVGGNDSSITLTAAGTGADAIGLVATGGGVAITAVDDLILTCASTAGADDIVIQQTGAQDASILLKAAGTGDDAISSVASAGGVLVQSTGATDNHIVISSSGTSNNALQVTTTAGGIVVTNGGASGEDLAIDGVLSAVTINSDEATTDSIDISSSLGGITIGSTAVASIWTHLSTGAADDLTFSLTGATDSSLILSSAGTGEDALSILATGTSGSAASILIDTADGGIVMTADGSSKGDITIDAADDVTITAVGKVVMNLGAEASTYQGNLLHAGQAVQTITTGSLTTAHCGYVNQVAVDGQTITLPATVAGVEFWIMNTAADDGSILTIDLAGADKFISGIFPNAVDGELIELTKVGSNYGDYIKVSAHTDGWIVTELVGTWAEDTP